MYEKKNKKKQQFTHKFCYRKFSPRHHTLCYKLQKHTVHSKLSLKDMFTQCRLKIMTALLHHSLGNMIKTKLSDTTSF